jgi:hypothetical protein
MKIFSGKLQNHPIYTRSKFGRDWLGGEARGRRSLRRRLMSTHASVLVDSVGPPSAEVYRAAASFP